MSAADYSDARPGGAALRAAGITAVGRYLGIPGDARVLELAEYQDLRAHGIDVWVNREGAATSMLGGYSVGLYHGQTAAANLRRLGLDPKSVVVYASADFDAQPAQFPAMDAYMDGFTAGLGSTQEMTGTYGSMPWINHCRANGKAHWFWQSASTSFTHGQTGFVHIQQTTLPSLAGTDNNILHAAVYGQIGAQPADVNAQPFNPEEADMPIHIQRQSTGDTWTVVAGRYIKHHPDAHNGDLAGYLTTGTGGRTDFRPLSDADLVIAMWDLGFNELAGDITKLPVSGGIYYRPSAAVTPTTGPVSPDQTVIDAIAAAVRAKLAADPLK